jgi:threonyl-tRNA synthetase
VKGVTFPSKKELDEYIKFLEEAKKRDHRNIGLHQGLFNIH